MNSPHAELGEAFKLTRGVAFAIILAYLLSGCQVGKASESSAYAYDETAASGHEQQATHDQSKMSDPSTSTNPEATSAYAYDQSAGAVTFTSFFSLTQPRSLHQSHLVLVSTRLPLSLGNGKSDGVSLRHTPKDLDRR